MVLDLLKFVKSAMKNFDQSEASIGSHMTTMEASDWSKFFNADLTYLSISKTILPLVIFLSGQYLNIFFSENPLLRQIPPNFFLWTPTLWSQWTIVKRKFSKKFSEKSYVVKILFFEWPISHWLRLLGEFSIRPCNGYGQSFPKWYDT